MNGLLQIRTAVITALKQAGLSAGAAFSGTAPYVTGTEATVRVATAAEQRAGFGCYLGQRCDESGLRPGNFKWEAARWEPENRLFLRRGTLSCRAFFTAEQNEDSEALLEFTLKGVMDG